MTEFAPSARRRLRTIGGILAAVVAASSLAAGALAAPASANPRMPHDPFGKIEHVTSATAGSVELSGWAADPDTTANAVVRALVDGKQVAKATTSIARPNVRKNHDTGPTPGYDFVAAVPKHGVHTLCVVVTNVGRGIGRVLGCRMLPLGTRLTSAQAAAHSPTGTILRVHATASAVEVTGWTADPDFRAGRIVTVLYLDGSPAETVNTTRSTAAQVAAGAGGRGAYGFRVSVTSGSHVGCVWSVNTGFGSNSLLGCQAFDTRGPAGTGKLPTPKINAAVVAKAKKKIGDAYVWGATGPSQFDCSGLVMFSYHKAGYTTPRIAQDQFAAARVIPASRAVPGDLVFYHDSVGAVYHVGIYLKPGLTVAAIDPAEGVDYQKIYGPEATYGSFTHT